jgi:hypothetical protein
MPYHHCLSSLPQEGPRKLEGMETEWDTYLLVYTHVNLLDKSINKIKENKALY